MTRIRLFLPILALTALVGLTSAQPHGIETRVPNNELLIGAPPLEEAPPMTLQRVFPGLSFSQMVLLVEIPDGSGRLAVVTQAGRIFVFPKEEDPSPESVDTFLDISGRTWNSGERGLLGVAFPEDYGETGEFYVSYVTFGGQGISRISRFTNSDLASNTVDEGTEEILLTLDQDFSNHNGGMIEFGPDGMLYIGFGDGGSGNDPNNRAQDTTNLFGAMLRIDVTGEPDPGLAYRVPPDNPFYEDGPAGTATRPEILAYGLRNPWRFSFDQINGHLFAADVGQVTREEVNIIIPGGDYGWREVEGSVCNPQFPDCEIEGTILPIVDYPRSEGQSITGGYVYYGDRLPGLHGMYVYGDFVAGRVFGLRYTGDGPVDQEVLVDSTGFNIAGFGQDASGEVYVLDYTSGDGGIHVLTPADPSPPPGETPIPNRLGDVPALLAAGLGDLSAIPGVIPYSPAAPQWADGALMERFIAIPGLGQIGYTESDGWNFPEETLLVQNLLLPVDEGNPLMDLRRIETRLLYLKDGLWRGYSYEWNEEESDAVLLTAPKDRPVTLIDTEGATREFTWRFPSRTECIQCHGAASNTVLGLTSAQLNSDFTYPESGVTDNQLRTLSHVSIFEDPPAEQPASLPAMTNPRDESAPLFERTRSHLATNCAMCHRPDGTAPDDMDLRFETALSEWNVLNEPPMGATPPGMDNPALVAPGHPERSVLLDSMNRLDEGRMPPVATNRIDEESVAMIVEWIEDIAPTAVEIWHAY